MKKETLWLISFIFALTVFQSCKEESKSLKMNIVKTRYTTDTKIENFTLDSLYREKGVGGLTITFFLNIPDDFTEKNPDQAYELICTSKNALDTPVFSDTIYTDRAGTKKIFIPYHKLNTLKKGKNILSMEVRNNLYQQGDSLRPEVRKFDGMTVASGIFIMPEVQKTALIVTKMETDTTLYTPSQMDFSMLWGSGYPDLFWEGTIGERKIYTSQTCKNTISYCRKDTTPAFFYVKGDSLRFSVYDFDAVSYHDFIGSMEIPLSTLSQPAQQFRSSGKIKILHIRPKP